MDIIYAQSGLSVKDYEICFYPWTFTFLKPSPHSQNSLSKMRFLYSEKKMILEIFHRYLQQQCLNLEHMIKKFCKILGNKKLRFHLSAGYLDFVRLLQSALTNWHVEVSSDNLLWVRLDSWKMDNKCYWFARNRFSGSFDTETWMSDYQKQILSVCVRVSGHQKPMCKVGQGCISEHACQRQITPYWNQ